MLPKLALYTGDGGMSAAYDRRSVGASLLLHHAKSGNARNSNATLKQQRSQPNSFVISPPMRAWLEQPHGRRHKAPPQPCALTTRAGRHINEFRFMSTRRSQGLQLGPPRNVITKVVVASARNRATVFLIRRGMAAVGIRMHFSQRHINDFTLNETMILEL